MTTSLQVQRFILVGIWNTLFGYLVFVVLVYVFPFGEDDSVWVLLITYLISGLQSYFAQRVLVWNSKAEIPLELLKFVLVTICGFLLNWILLHSLHKFLMESILLAQLVAILMTTIATFFVLKNFAFTGTRQEFRGDET